MADSAKAIWSPEHLHIFCDICIRAIDMGMRPTSHFDKPGWMYVAQSFAEQTGVEFQREQFKNKWDSCKKNWRLWNKLIGETGSNELKTIAASDEWWRARIQVTVHVDKKQNTEKNKKEESSKSINQKLELRVGKERVRKTRRGG
uniref:Myb/SANT-like domain-containing protein n=1 Tax=Salix viminalis TaxID=40686 RepID=A0A6N2MA47_SALVM